ncbi:Sialidase [Myxozyma melibiosi]|uniref:Sialidase n=1 Tax=Myxozyma melibiosi TaxID=54550 RepID=A0ABR1F0P7_9ASCO
MLLFLVLFVGLFATFGAAVPRPSTFKVPTVSNVTIFVPPSDYNIPRTLYAHSLELPDGTLLATWENYSPEPPLVYFPIYKSTDNGATWKHISNVTDQTLGWGLRYQPSLHVLSQRIGRFPAGTVLLAGNAIPTDLNYTQIDLYASFNGGHSWKFVSHVAAGGEAVPDNGLTPVWEPYMLEYKGKLVIYYSDQRFSDYGQLLDHQVSGDLINWSDPVFDVRYPTYTDRPGMASLALLPNGEYIYTYEYGGGGNYSSYTFPVFYKRSKDPLLLDEVEGVQLISQDGTEPSSSPYVTWSPVGGPNGTIIVTSASNTEVFINRALGDPNEWQTVETGVAASYSRDVRALSGGRLLIMGGGVLSGESNYVYASTFYVKDLIDSVN